MLLRRVIAHLRKQEWTAIAIDFLIVVIGVFVGLQVNNWNAARTDQARAANYLERLSYDLSADLATFEDRMQFWSDVSAYGALSLAYAEAGATGGKSQWELLLAFFQASQVAEFYTTDAPIPRCSGPPEPLMRDGSSLPARNAASASPSAPTGRSSWRGRGMAGRSVRPIS